MNVTPHITDWDWEPPTIRLVESPILCIGDTHSHRLYGETICRLAEYIFKYEYLRK